MRKHMKWLAPAFALLAILLLALYVASSVAPADAPWIAEEGYDYGGDVVIRVVQDAAPSVQTQIDMLKELGFSADQVDEQFFLEQLYAMWDEWILLRYPYWLVFTALGSEYDMLDPENPEGSINYREPPLQREEIGHYSNCVFNFMRVYCGTCEHYVYILDQINRISGGQIRLENIESGRALGFGRLWVSFTLNGVDYKYSIPEREGRFNPEILTVIGTLAGADGEGRMLFWNGDEQGVHIVYCTRDTLMQLAERTGINFWGLDSGQVALW